MSRRAKVQLAIFLTSLTFLAAILGVLLVHRFPQNTFSLKDIRQLLLYSIIVWGFWLLRLRPLVEETEYELGDWFFLFLFLIRGPIMAVSSYVLGMTFYEFFSHKVPLRPKLAGILVNIIALSASFMLFAPFIFFDTYFPLRTFLFLFLIDSTQNFLFLFLGIIYLSIIDEEVLSKMLKMLFSQKNLFVYSLSVIFSPTLALIAAYFWLHGMYWWLLFVVIIFFVIRNTVIGSQLRQELEETLQKLKATEAQLVHAEKMAGLGQLVAGVAHELNNPLNFLSMQIPMLQNHISQLLQLLSDYEACSEVLPSDLREKLDQLKKMRKRDELPTSFERAFKGLHEGTHRSRNIVENLRLFARVEQVGETWNYIDIKEALDSTLQILSPSYEKRVQVYRLEGELPKLWCKPSLVNQLFTIILSNAFQAIKGEGSVWLLGHVNDVKVQISIRDSGVGISEEIQKKIFDPFFTTKEVGEGTGLGLSVAYGIMKEHHGEIRVESKVGEGSTFYLIFPLSK